MFTFNKLALVVVLCMARHHRDRDRTTPVARSGCQQPTGTAARALCYSQRLARAASTAAGPVMTPCRT